MHRFLWFKHYHRQISTSASLNPLCYRAAWGASVFTRLDLRSAYNLVWLRAGDEWKPAFSMTSGHYKYNVSLVSAPSFFQSFMNDMFWDMLNCFVVAYIDDILMYFRSFTEHVAHVRKVLCRLLDHRLYVKAENCEFHKKEIAFLGYRIGPEGVNYH